MKRQTADISAPATHNTFSSPASFPDSFDHWIQVHGISGHTIQVHGTSGDAVAGNYDVLTGSGTSGQLPTDGNITADGWYEVPQAFSAIKCKKTDAEDVTAIPVTLSCRIYLGPASQS